MGGQSGQGQHGGLSRRNFLGRSIGLGGLIAVGGTGLFAGMGGAQTNPVVPTTMRAMRLMSTDGYMSLPGRRLFPALAGETGDPNPVYVFGFRAVDSDAETSDPVGDLINKYKGKVHVTAPTIDAEEGQEIALVLSNLGLIDRPDLDDSHSLHWHGFPNATAIFDGVPELSIAVPANRDFPYYYLPKTSTVAGKPWLEGSAGTYMYHCHFESTEHVQMGMNGIIFVRPTIELDARADSAQWAPGDPHFAYNDRTSAGSLYHPNIDTSFDREYALLLGEIDTVPHDGLLAVQEFVWTDYEPNYWTINSRAYPDTIVPNIDPAGADHDLMFQPNSSLIQINEGERGLLRMANLGFEIHTIELDGPRMNVVGGDASLLLSPALDDMTYWTSRIDIGPGEARDLIFVAPGFIAADALTDSEGLQYNRYYLRTRNAHRRTNAGSTDLGGMVTEVWVYPGSLPTQMYANETYPEYANPGVV